MDFFQMDINHETWTFYLLDKDDEVVMDAEDNAVTDCETLEVHFRPEGVTYFEVRHEVWHIMRHFCFTETAELTDRQDEEISAELYAYRGKLMDKLSEEILQKLKELKEKKDAPQD